MDIQNLARETHDAEIIRKGELTDSLAFPTGLLTVLIAALGTMMSEISFPFAFLERLLLALTIAAIIPIGAAAVFLIKARIAHVYDYPASITAVRTWYESIINLGYTEDEAKENLAKFLFDEYVKCAGVNSFNNDTRSAQIFKANQAVVVLIAITALAGVPFLALKMESGPLPSPNPSNSVVVMEQVTGVAKCLTTETPRRSRPKIVNRSRQRRQQGTSARIPSQEKPNSFGQCEGR